MTDSKAWEQATEDARFTLGEYLNTIEELNRRAFDVTHLNAILTTALAAVVYRFDLSAVELGFLLAGGFGIVFASLISFELLRTSSVSIGVPPSIYEDLKKLDITADQYHRQVTGVTYPKAIRDARTQSDRYSNLLNKIYWMMGGSIGLLGIGALYGYFLT